LEHVERHPGTDKDESGDIEQGIDYTAENCLFRLPIEETVPGKRYSTRERSKEIIGAQQSSDSDR
jgi:hypothetical protein